MAAPGGLRARGGARPGGLRANTGAARKHQDDDADGVLGFLENLGTDVKDTLVGFPAGIAQTVRHPVETAKGIGATYAATYGPLFRGDVGEFAHQLYQHPLGPILDLATVLSLGYGSIARGGAALGKAGIIAQDSRLARLTEPSLIRLESPAFKSGIEGGKIIVKPTSGRPLRKAQQVAFDRFLKQFPADTPLVGEFARLARELDRVPRRTALARQLDMKPYQKAYLRLSEAEQIALGIIGRGLTVEGYKGLLLREQAAGAYVEPRMLALLDRADVRKAVENPSPRLLKTLEKGRDLGERAAAILGEHERLTPEAAEARRFLPALLERGAEFVPDEEAVIARYGTGEIADALTAKTKWDALVDKVAEQYKPSKVDVAIRNKGAKKRARKGLKPEQTAKQEARKLAEKQLLDAVRKRADAGDESARRILAELDEDERVRARLVQEQEDRAFGDLNERLGGRARDTAGAIQPGQIVHAADRENYGRVVAVNGDTAIVHFINRLHGYEATVELPTEILTPVSRGSAFAGIEKILTAPDGQTLAGMVEQLKAEGVNPLYLPDIMAEGKRTFIGRAGGGLGVPKNPVHKNVGVLFLSGQLALQPDVLSVAYLRTVRFALHDDLHNELLASAIPVAKGEPLPAGYVYIRRPVGKSRRPERISHTQQQLRDFRDEIERVLPEDDRVEFGTRSVEDAVVEGAHFLAIPEALAKQAAGEFLRSGKAVRWLLEKPTTVWRTLVLNLRPAWLVNNIVGNHFLYALRFAGVNGLVAYVRAVRDAGRASAPFRRLVETYVPEQAAGTFLQTQSPKLGRKTSRAVNVATAGLRPLDVASEQTLRRAAVETVLRRQPEVKARLHRMWGETEVFDDVAEKALQESPELARRVSDEVNAALGDFMHLSVFERQTLRAVLPFYGWYRAITLVIAKMPLETPGRAALLVRLGQVGVDETEAALGEIPSYLKGAIPFAIAGRRARVFNTTPVNPFSTPAALSENISSTINPIAAVAARATLGDDRFSAVPFTEAVQGIGRGGYDLGAGLPQVRLAQALTGKLYQGTATKPTLYRRTKRDELLAYLGIPYRDLSLARAEQLAGEERSG